MAIFVTGDTHMPHDIEKINSNEWTIGNDLTKDDYLIVLGDFGLILNPIRTDDEDYWTEWLNNKPWTTLFVDGNHENHHRLNRLSKIEMFDSIVGKVSDSIYHLKRGNIYTIQNKTFFCMGGALSIDKQHRTEGVSWWPEERPSYMEKEYGLQNLEKVNNKVDYILTHTLPTSLLKELGITLYPQWFDDTCDYIQLVCDTVDYKHGYCGHWHMDKYFRKYTTLFQDVVQVC